MSADERWRGELRAAMAGKILFDEPAAGHTSIGVGGRIDALCVPESVEELASVAAFLRARGIPFLPVGNWTNLIVRDGGYRGVLISTVGIRALNASEGTDGGIRLEAQAGLPLSELVNLAVHKALTGIEFCAGIQGSVGGAVRMNAGAYGGEIKDICLAVRLIGPTEEIRTVPRAELDFSYRNLDLPAETIIIGAAFYLRRGEAEAIARRVREIIGSRKEKHPLEFPNAGSIFKNPQGVPAGKLIEQAGLKGLRIGDAQVSEKHGNFIVNRGRATAGEILGVIERVQKRVHDATGHALELEVRIIGK